MKSGFLKNGVLGVLFILPLLGVGNDFGYEQTKVLFFIFSISLLGFLWRGKGLKWTLISKVGGVFILTLFVTSLMGADSKSSFLGKSPYFQGLFLYCYLYLFYLIVKTFEIELSKYVLVLSVSALIVSLLAIKDWLLLNIFHQFVPTYANRIVSTFGQSNFLGGFLLLTIPFSYLIFKLGKHKLVGISSLILSITGIFLSESRAAMVILFIMLFCWYINFLINFKRRIAFLIIGLFTLFFIFIANQTWKGLWAIEVEQSFDSQWLIYNSPEKRIFFWPVIIELINRRMLTGYGLENLSSAFSHYPNFYTKEAKPAQYFKLRELNLDRSHNYILDLLVFSGLLGCVAYIIFVIQLLGTKNKLLLTSLLIYLVWSQFQNQSIVHLTYFWLVAGLIDRK